MEQEKENKPFQSAILLTPTKNSKYLSDGEPYKSPYCLPSVSPLLKKYNNIAFLVDETNEKIEKILNKRL